MTRMNAVLFATMAAASSLLAARPAEACSPAYEPQADEIGSVTALAEANLPRNAGVPFAVFAGKDVDDAAILARVHIKLQQGTTPVEGALTRIARSGARATFLWKPKTGDLPSGAITLEGTITNRGIEQALSPRTLTVDDRALTLVDRGASVVVERTLIGDSKAPAIVCKRQRGGGECSSGEEVRNISTRVVAVPVARFTAPLAAPGDVPFINTLSVIYGRDKNGTKSNPSEQMSGSSSSFTLDRAYDEYCVDTTTSLLGDDAAPVTKTTCTSQAIDLAVDLTLESETILESLSGCETKAFPPGTSEDNPTGLQRSSARVGDEGMLAKSSGSSDDDSGCSVGRRTTAPTGGIAAAMLGLALVLRRRRRA